MPFMQFIYRSDALNKQVTVNVILPVKPDKEYKTLYLLHGLGDDQNAWTRKSSIERYAEQYGIAVVMPNGDIETFGATVAK